MCILGTAIVFLNENSGAVQTVANVVIALFAVLSFVISARALKEASNTRKDSKIPILRVGMSGPNVAITNSGTEQYISVQIKNVGDSIARNIKIFLPNKDPAVVRSLDTDGEWSVKIILGTEEVMRMDNLPDEQRIIEVEYKDIFSRTIRTRAMFENTHQESSPTFRVTQWDPILPS